MATFDTILNNKCSFSEFKISGLDESSKVNDIKTRPLSKIKLDRATRDFDTNLKTLSLGGIQEYRSSSIWRNRGNKKVNPLFVKTKDHKKLQYLKMQLADRKKLQKYRLDS